MNSSYITDLLIHCLTTDPLGCLSGWTSGLAYFTAVVIVVLLTIPVIAVCYRRYKEAKEVNNEKAEEKDKNKNRPVREIKEETVREIKGPWKEKLLRSYKRLVQDTDPDTVIDDCFQEGIITSDERDEILAYRTKSKQNRHLIKILLRQSEDTYKRFLECLTDSHTKKLILETDVKKPLRHAEKNEHFQQLRRQTYCNLQTIVDGPELKNITDDFISERVLEIEDLEKITNDNLTTKQQNINFLNCLLKTEAHGFHLLLSELKQSHPDVVNKIETTAVTEDIDRDIVAHLRIVDLEERGVNLTREEKERIKMNLDPEEISLGKLKSWTNNQKSFYQTKATEHIYKEVKSKRNCLTTGLPGSGKTANLQHVALRLKNEGHRLCCVQTFKELLSKVDKFGEEEKQVYFVDDVFGVHGVSEDKTKEWTGADKDDLERCLNNTNISILCSSRKQVTDDPKLSNIKSRFTIINISEGELGLSSEEHVGIFERHAITKQRKNLLTENKEQLKTEIKEKVSEIKCPVGCFPLVCHLYTGEEEPKLTMEEYFNKPLNVIADHLKKLKVEDRLSHFCLLLCLIYDNKLPVNIITVGDESKETKKQRKELLELCKLPVATSREDIREKMDTLLKTFVKLEGGMYQFVHDIIHDAVIKHVSCMSSSLHQFIIRYCSSKFMRYRVHLSGVVCKEPWGRPGHDTESCINIRLDSFTFWGFRMLDIVRDGFRTSDQLYNDIDEGRCSKYDRRVYDNPWRDVFEYNRCVHSTEGQTAIVQALKSSEVQTIMCTKGYRLYGGPRVTGLHWAMWAGLTHIVRQTVSMLSPTQLREVDSIHDGGLLCSAIDKRYGTDVIQALIVGGVDVNTPDVYGNTPLCLAIGGGCGTDVIQALIVRGVNVNTPDVYGNTPLCSAIRGRCGTDVIQALIDSGVDVNTPNVDGRTPLCLAISGRCGTDVIQALIVGGADVNTPDVDGRTPLCLAIRGRCGTDVIQVLIVGGADVNTPDVYGLTPLCSAIIHRCGADMIQALIVGGADVNTPGVDGDIPLYESVSRGDYNITKLLVDNGADVNQCDEDGTSVLYKSQLYGRDTITELLQSRGAVCMYRGKRYTTITDIPDSEVDSEWIRRWIQKLKEKQNVTK